MTAMCRWQLYCLVAAFALADVVLGDAPRAELHSGGSIPLVGLGTGRDQELEAAVDAALAAGYRLFDTATLYKNEHIIGRVLKRWLQEGKVKREDLFIVTKLPPFGMRAGDVSAILAKSLSDLQLDYVDMYLIHMPYGLARDGFDENWDVKSGAWDMTTDHAAIWKFPQHSERS